MINKTKKFSLTLFLLVGLTATSFAKQQNVTTNELKEVTSSISTLMKSNYIFPKQADKMAALLTRKLNAGEYNNLTKPMALSDQLTKDLQSVNNDLHIRVRFEPERITQMKAMENQPENEQALASDLKHMKKANYGFKDVQILPGNIGYINLTNFSDTKYGGDTAVAAMNLVANTDAIIFDLRENGGGSPAMIQLITSYLFDAEPIHLNSFYWRPQNETTQTWTLPHVNGKRNTEANVYVLTSKRTFSAAEEFSYNLKNLKRATLIGETTGGGAHPGGTTIASDRFTVWIPQGRAINPITQDNWEGTGVTPHLAVEKTKAFKLAHKKALEDLIIKKPEESFSYQWQLDSLIAEDKNISFANGILESYAGDYGNRILSVENNELYYQRKGQEKTKLTALNQELFMMPGVNYFRLKIIKQSNKVVALEGLYDNGTSDRSNKEI